MSKISGQLLISGQLQDICEISGISGQLGALAILHAHVSKKNIPDIFDCNLKINYQILIIFGTHIPDTTCHQMTIQFPTSLNVCFCTIWGKHNQRNITFFIQCDMTA